MSSISAITGQQQGCIESFFEYAMDAITALVSKIFVCIGQLFSGIQNRSEREGNEALAPVATADVQMTRLEQEVRANMAQWETEAAESSARRAAAESEVEARMHVITHERPLQLAAWESNRARRFAYAQKFVEARRAAEKRGGKPEDNEALNRRSRDMALLLLQARLGSTSAGAAYQTAVHARAGGVRPIQTLAQAVTAALKERFAVCAGIEELMLASVGLGVRLMPAGLYAARTESSNLDENLEAIETFRARSLAHLEEVALAADRYERACRSAETFITSLKAMKEEFNTALFHMSRYSPLLEPGNSINGVLNNGIENIVRTKEEYEDWVQLGAQREGMVEAARQARTALKNAESKFAETLARMNQTEENVEQLSPDRELAAREELYTAYLAAQRDCITAFRAIHNWLK